VLNISARCLQLISKLNSMLSTPSRSMQASVN
jgi:hypothetical protein